MQKKEVCWNITTKCNQNCKYCHRFLGINDLCYEENERILDNLINIDINQIKPVQLKYLNFFVSIISLILKLFNLIDSFAQSSKFLSSEPPE